LETDEIILKILMVVIDLWQHNGTFHYQTPVTLGLSGEGCW